MWLKNHTQSHPVLQEPRQVFKDAKLNNGLTDSWFTALPRPSLRPSRTSTRTSRSAVPPPGQGAPKGRESTLRRWWRGRERCGASWRSWDGAGFTLSSWRLGMCYVGHGERRWGGCAAWRCRERHDKGRAQQRGDTLTAWVWMSFTSWGGFQWALTEPRSSDLSKKAYANGKLLVLWLQWKDHGD